jgi:hypothetical protein
MARSVAILIVYFYLLMWRPKHVASLWSSMHKKSLISETQKNAPLQNIGGGETMILQCILEKQF